MSNDPCLLSPKTIPVSTELQTLMQNSGFSNNSNRTTYLRFTNSRKQTFTSTEYTRQIRTIDYFISTIDERMGKVNFYFLDKGISYAVIEEYQHIQKENHILEVIAKNAIIIPANEIKGKLICMEIAGKIYVTSAPNNYEKD